MIRRVLVANRGEIAVRVFDTCHSLGIGTVAVYSEPDADAPFVFEADVAVPLGGTTPAESYLRGDAIIEAARLAGADAIHPGYGFLAENAAFARAVLDAGLTWIGPSPEVIEAMGSKIRARELMEQAGVPILPGHHLVDETGVRPGRTPKGIAERFPGDALAKAGAKVGYPLLVKASAGGGGKGMRTVNGPEELAGAVDAASGEAERAFGDGAVFLERLATGARHVEIQILGDEHGTVAALPERDCSVQRRHQKVIEESPSPAVDDKLRDKMAAAAVAAGRSLGYVGAGTVEFLLLPESDGGAGEFFFLEVNTRLQVEHPVTELVTGLDLVELQLHIAEGGELPEPVLHPVIMGHAIEARLYAEDPAADFLPQTGTLTRFAFDASGDAVRVDAGVSSDHTTISPFYDPMLAKVIAHGRSREGAVRVLADALARAEIHGAQTNRDFLVNVLRHDAFGAGEADTGFLDRHDPAVLATPLVTGELLRVAAAMAVLAAQAEHRADAAMLGGLPSGWRNNPSVPQRLVVEAAGEELTVEYRFVRDGKLAEMTVGGEPIAGAILHHAGHGRVELEAGGLRHTGQVTLGAGGAAHVNLPAGQADLRLLPRFTDPAEALGAGSLTSPMPGTVVRVLAAEGDEVAAGRPLLVLEAMKMEHEIVAPADGVLTELRVAQGTQVESGAILAVLEEPA